MSDHTVHKFLSNFTRTEISVMNVLNNLIDSAGRGGIEEEQSAGSLFAEGVCSYNIYMQSGELEEIDNAIEFTKEGLQLTEQSDGNHAGYLSNIAAFLGARFERSGEIQDLEEAINTTRQAVESSPSDHLDLAGRLNNLGSWLGRRFERSGEMQDLEEAINTTRQAVESTLSDHSDLAGRLNNLGSWLGTRFERSGEMQDLEEAINITRQAVKSSPSDHPNLVMYLNNLGNWLRTRFERSREMQDLEEAIDITRQAVESTPSSHPNLAIYLNGLGISLGRRFEQSGEIQDLEGAINIARQAVESTPSDHPDLAMYLNNLGNWLRTRFERSGEIQDLREAINTTRQAVKSTPSDHPDLAMYLNGLGNSLGRRFERSGEIQDLEEAINMTRQAVESSPSDHPNLAGRLNNLGSWLGTRFERSGEMQDLEEAINTTRQAVESTPSDHPDLVMYLNNLGISLRRRFERSGEIQDLEEAINTARQTVESTLSDHLMYLNVLGNSLGRRFERSGEIQDLEEAINTTRQAVELSPSDHPNLVMYLNNLGNWLRTRFERSGEMQDLEEAINTTRQAVESTPSSHPNLAMYLNGLGNSLRRRFERSGEMKDLEDMTECYQGAFECTGAVPLERVKAAARCLDKLSDLHKTHEAIKLGREALELLPIVNNRNLDRSDQQFALSGFAGIASDLCALLLSEGCVHEAVERLEQGRAIIISRLLDDRSDVSGLCQEYPKLGEHYQSLVAEVNTPFGSTEDINTVNTQVMRRRKAVTELEACLRDIRSIPGHERFLLGQTVAQMQEDMCDGCVVLVNISTIRNDAVVMTRDSLQAIHLSDLDKDDARRWLNTKWTIRRRSQRRQKNDQFLEYLAWLWNVCVEEILNHISTLYKGRHPPLPRVWWIGCGLASSMPFHAAGVHAHGSFENAFSRVISSYTPSVKALGYSRSQIKHARSDQPARDQMLITLMPKTPKGANDKGSLGALGGVSKEKERILAIVSPYVSPVVRETPDAGVILSQLVSCQIAHFACHGMSDPTDPSSSGLVLQRLASDGTLEQDHLSVYRISHLRLRHVKIAYLSACSTAENKGTQLRDEVIHIVSGFQVAGFPHVIGSLWPAGDDECVEVASGFYSSLFTNKAVPEWGARRVAWALREAVMAVRAEDMDMPLNWAQFVHFGA